MANEKSQPYFERRYYWFMVTYGDVQQGRHSLQKHDVLMTTLEDAVEGLTGGVPVTLDAFETSMVNLPVKVESPCGPVYGGSTKKQPHHHPYKLLSAQDRHGGKS